MFAATTSRIAAAAAAALSLAACSGGSSPTAPASPAGGPQTSSSCAAQLTLDLQKGQTAPLSGQQAACFRLAAHSGARYVLAGFDARSIEAARQGPEPSPGGQPVYVMTDGSAASAQSLPGADRTPAPRPLGDATAQAALDPTSPFARTTPWVEGERFPIKRVDTGETVTAQVVRVMGGRYVFAVVDADRESHTDDFIRDTEKGMSWLLANGIPVMDRTWGAGQPVTSAGSGQVLIVYSAWNLSAGTGAATTYAAEDGSGVGTYVWLNLNARPGNDNYTFVDVPSFRLKTLAHELTHAWQMRYVYTTQPAGQHGLTRGPTWAMEGTADYVAMDLVRRYLGVGLTSNWNWRTRLLAPNDGITLALEPAGTAGRLSWGYYDAASFLQDVQQRLVRRGMGADEAMAQVARGAVEGWFGVDAAGVRRQGLADRVRAVLGAQWEPSDAVLLWTLTQAADDDSDNPELNNPLYESAADPDNAYAWQSAHADVQAGDAFSFQLTRSPGTSFFVRIKDGGSGGTVSLSASVDGTRWMIARVK